MDLVFKGIDISKYNGRMDYNEIKKRFDFVIIRAVSTNKQGLYIDPYFEENYQKCKEYGIPCGVYYYSYATNNSYAKKELDLLFKALDGKHFEYPVAIDIEDKSLQHIGQDKLADIINFQADLIKQAGYYPMLYTYKSYTKYINMAKVSHLDLWIAEYGRNTGAKPYERPTYKGSYTMWQYSSVHPFVKATGIKTVDINECYVDYPKIIKGVGHKPIENNTINKDDKPITESLIEEILDGKWGNGYDRKIKLEREGYNPRLVQAEVNKFLNANPLYLVALDVIKGLYGNGLVRKMKLKIKGYSPYKVQLQVNKIMQKR